MKTWQNIPPGNMQSQWFTTCLLLYIFTMLQAPNPVTSWKAKVLNHPSVSPGAGNGEGINSAHSHSQEDHPMAATNQPNIPAAYALMAIFGLRRIETTAASNRPNGDGVKG
jgi:hypothetical protein